MKSLILLALAALLLGACFPMPITAPPQAAQAPPPCPCPEFVLSRGGVLVEGEDPDGPPPCAVMTNCGRHIPVDAAVLVECQEEARKRARKDTP